MSFAAWIACAARSSAGWILVIAASSAGSCLAAEPYVAKGLIQVFQVDSSGGEHLVNSIQLLEARNRLGSRYSLQEDNNGRRASLWDSSSGLMYSLDSRAKKAMVVDKMLQYMEGGRAAPQAADLGSQSSHLNIPCVRFPVRQGMPGKLATIGESCVSLDLELVLRSEGKMEVDGKTVIVRRAMTDVRMGEEPDASWFNIPQDYTVIQQPPRKR
jgi:hypothetical protein